MGFGESDEISPSGQKFRNHIIYGRPLTSVSFFIYIGDGNVSFEEFVDILSNMAYEEKSGLSSADQEERELRDAFRVFDKHNRGYITASDLRAVLQCLGEDLDEEESKSSEKCLHFYFNKITKKFS